MAVYALTLFILRRAIFALAVVVAIVAVIDWAVRTRRISPFSPVARFCRRAIDPMLVPVERTVIRAGGRPAAAPWWALVTVIVGGVVLLYVLDFVGTLLAQFIYGLNQPATLPIVLVSWAFKLLELALIVRVLVSWLPISPYSKWVRWSFTLTEWMLAPLRRIIPTLGVIDITPLVAYLALAWVLEPVVLNAIRSMVHA